MKKLILILSIIGYAYHANAQQTVTTTRVMRPAGIGNKIVKDSTGTVLPVAEWRKLMISGKYILHSNNPGSDTMTLVKLNPAELERNMQLMPLPPESPAFPVGTKKELFNAKDINGNKVDLKGMEGKIVVLNFWFIACEPCRMEMPELNQLAANNPDVVFIGIGLDSKNEIKEFVKTTPFNYQLVYDARQDCKTYGITGYPTNVVIDKKGITRFSTTGYSAGTLNFLKKTLAQVKAEN